MTTVIGISGKLGAGKDHLSGLLQKTLIARGFTFEYNMFAKYLKQQTDEVLSIIRQSPADAATIIADSMDMNNTQAAHLVALLKTAALEDESVTAYTRAPYIRAALQYLGTEVRRNEDPDYWTKLYENDVEVATTDFMFATDCRFPNEADTANKHGITIRLEVPGEVLNERRMKRDGFLPPESVVNHISETALDDYENFTIILGADYNIDDVIQQVLVALKK